MHNAIHVQQFRTQIQQIEHNWAIHMGAAAELNAQKIKQQKTSKLNPTPARQLSMNSSMNPSTMVPTCFINVFHRTVFHTTEPRDVQTLDMHMTSLSAFEDMGRNFPVPEPRLHHSASGTPRPVQVNTTHMVTSDTSQVMPNTLGSPLHRNMTGSDVLCPASRAFYEVGDDWRSTPAPEDETESQLSYEYSVREGPENPGYAPTSSSSDIVHQESEEDHVRHLKLWAKKAATKFNLKASQFSELTMFIKLATNHKLLNGLEEMKSYMVNTKNAVESATAGIRSGFQLSANQAVLHIDVEERLRMHANSYGFQNVFGNPANKHMLHAAIKKECSAVRNKFCMLYWWGGESALDAGGTYMDSSEQIQSSQHYYGQQLKKAASRVVKKGQPWKDMKNDKWRDFFNEIIIQDQERYGTNSGSMLPLLPSMYTELPLATASPNPGTSSTIVYHGTSHTSQPLARQFSSSDMIPQATCSFWTENTGQTRDQTWVFPLALGCLTTRPPSHPLLA
ncbi:hypothetical protein F5141DRAFT_1065901 [Pisolithus sp. B1]|nr:hypothetical protein F5141DRAFT_1065901 [Pisolithus sp. B1]